jgi:hypothetical protein
MRDQFGPIAFLPTEQETQPDLYTEIMIQSSLPLPSLLSAIKRTVAEVNPNIDLDFHVFKTQIQESLLRERLMATLSGVLRISCRIARDHWLVWRDLLHGRAANQRDWYSHGTWRQPK